MKNARKPAGMHRGFKDRPDDFEAIGRVGQPRIKNKPPPIWPGGALVSGAFAAPKLQQFGFTHRGIGRPQPNLPRAIGGLIEEFEIEAVGVDRGV